MEKDKKAFRALVVQSINLLPKDSAMIDKIVNEMLEQIEQERIKVVEKSFGDYVAKALTKLH